MNRVPLPCGTNFLWLLIFAIFAVFPAIRKNKFPQIKITANIFPAKIYPRVNILYLKFATQKYSTRKSSLFNHNLHFSFRNNEILVYVYCLKICISIARTQEKRKYYHFWVLGTGYFLSFLKIAKTNSQLEKSICPNCFKFHSPTCSWNYV